MFIEIFNDAYNAYVDGGNKLMWEYLSEQIYTGEITEVDAERIAEDVVNTYNL